MDIRKWLGGLLIVLLVAVFMFVLTTDIVKPDEQAAPVQVMDARIGSLVFQKSNLIKQRDKVQQEYINRIQGLGTVTLLFTKPDAVFMEIVAPIMMNNEIVGMVAFGPDQYPGQGDCISMEQWRQLEQAGWEVCLLWDGSAHLSEWMPRMNAQLEAIGLAPSLSVYVPEDLFETELIVAARQLNLKALIHQNADTETHHKIQHNDVWLTKAIPWHLDNTSERVEAIIRDGGSIVLEVYNEIVWDGGYRRLFQSMLEKLLDWQDDNKIRISTINQSISYRQNVLMGSVELEAEMRSHLESLSLAIEELDAQIDDANNPEASPGVN